MLIFTVIFIIKKKILIHKRYMHNSGQNDFDLFVDYIKAKIVIISTIGLDFFWCQGDAII